MSQQACGSRLMPILRIAARVGEVQNTAVMRRAAGFPVDAAGAREFGRTLRNAVLSGYLEKRHLHARRCVWGLTKRGQQAVSLGRLVAMRGMPYTRCEAFFNANPGEEMTYQQMAVKFGIPLKSVRWLVTRLVRNGLAERVLVVRAVKQQEAA